MEGKITLKYDGGDASRGELDAYAAAEAIKSFYDFSKYLTSEIYGEEAQIEARISAFHKGSHEIEFLLHLTEGAALLKSVADAFSGSADFINLFKDVFSLIKHLKGNPPKEVRKAENGSFFVENNSGEINVFNNPTINLVVRDPQLSKAASGFVNRPLRTSAHSLALMNGNAVIDRINEEQSRSFVPLNLSNTLTTNTAETYLTISTAVLEGSNSWKFSDGRSSITAKIEDDEFLNKVQNGLERFGKGDGLRVMLRSTQLRERGNLKATYAIEKVLDHFKNNSPGQREL
ncbi:MAG: hypothetical protein RIG26_18915 [Thalassospira sp.]|uniref:hypothetical protein n=1 Tax=Thalassospira sp. TaxID=1912094 RepID=UPI0032EEFE64